MPTIDVIPTGGAQVCNFSTSEEALEYAEARPPEVAKGGSREVLVFRKAG